MTSSIKLFGIPYDMNSSFLQGPSLAPSRIRLVGKEGSANTFSEDGRDIQEGVFYTDLGDMTLGKIDPKNAYDKIFSKVKNEIDHSQKLMCLGGDHSVSYPIIAAHLTKYPRLNILQFDAHTDLYDSFDNNPYSHASPFARLMETGKVNSLTQVGIRCLTSHQVEQANRFEVKIVEMRKLSDTFLSQLEGPLYISLDMDVLDPACAPGVSHHEPGGMMTRQLIDFIQRIDVEVIGADIVEYNPIRDIHNMTAMVGYKLMKEVMSKMST